MENLIIMILFLGTNAAAYFLHVLQKRKEFKRHIGEMVFVTLFIASIPIFLMSYLMTEPFDYYIGAFRIFVFFLSINGFGVTKMLEKVNKRKTI